jgi:hypothetical protein
MRPTGTALSAAGLLVASCQILSCIGDPIDDGGAQGSGGSGGARGGGTFTDSGQALGNGDSEDVALGDVDGDGDLDAVVANSGQHNRVWRNDGSGTFTDSGPVPLPRLPRQQRRGAR